VRKLAFEDYSTRELEAMLEQMKRDKSRQASDARELVDDIIRERNERFKQMKEIEADLEKKIKIIDMEIKLGPSSESIQRTVAERILEDHRYRMNSIHNPRITKTWGDVFNELK
jgi:hypothetical protein